MNKILFDLAATQPNSNGKRHGGGIYGEVVFRRIVERKMPVSAFYDSSRWFNPEIKQLIVDKEITLYDIKENDLQVVIDNGGYDFLYTPLVENYLANIRNCKIKATVHGLRNFELPLDYFRFKYKKEFTIKRFLRFLYRKYFHEKALRKEKGMWRNRIKPEYEIITVSNHSACSLKVFFPHFLEKKVNVFYSPLQYKPQNDNGSMNKKKEDRKFFLLVSGNRWEKNNLRAVMALDKLFSQGMISNYHVVITGASSSDVYRYKIINKDRFVFKGYVDDDALRDLYRQAFCLIYPSLNEGFGYPPLEAMQFGTPVLASPFASIPEVCGDAAIYFNPFSIDEIMNRIIMICDKITYNNYTIRAKERFWAIKAKQEADLDKLVDYLYQN